MGSAQDMFASLVVMVAGCGILAILVGLGLSGKPKQTPPHETRNKD